MRAPVLSLVVASFVWLSPSASAAGVALRVAHADDVATTITLAATERLPLGSVALPPPGATETVDVTTWLLLLQGAAGVALAANDEDENRPTVAVAAGVLRRLGRSFPDRVGLVCAGSVEPWGAGPAVRAEAMRAFALEAGGLWYEDRAGFRWYAGIEVSTAFLRDVF